MRERLIELLLADVECDKDGHGDCSMCEYKSAEDECVKHLATLLADHLLANGVIVPPCKVGDTVWVHNQTAGKIFKNTVVGIFVSGASPHRNGIKCEYRNICGETSNRKFTFAQIGKTVFLTREEAEQALKGEHHG